MSLVWRNRKPVPSPDTSAQDAPVASQEAEARAWLEPDHAEFCVCIMQNAPESECDCDYAGEVDKLDAYAAAIRASERAKVEALVEAATEIAGLPMLRGESGVGATYTVTYKDTGVMDRLVAALDAVRAGRAK